jgi:hypothetical protein
MIEKLKGETNMVTKKKCHFCKKPGDWVTINEDQKGLVRCGFCVLIAVASQNSNSKIGKILQSHALQRNSSLYINERLLSFALRLLDSKECTITLRK